MILTQQWRYLNLTRNSFTSLFPAKGIMSYRQTISSRLYIRPAQVTSAQFRQTFLLLKLKIS